MIRLGLATENGRRHMTDESWQIFAGLYENGYTLCGYNMKAALGAKANEETSIPKILEQYNPNIVVIQDKREWDHHSKEPRAYFGGSWALKSHDCFKATILKDAHNNPYYHNEASRRMGINAHVIYYDEETVRKQAPWLKGPVIRTYHTIDKDLIPPYSDRYGVALLSGALSKAYPLRQKLANNLDSLPEGTCYLAHPGYKNYKCFTPSYLKELSRFRVAICTCSVYKYALRKIIEATACGCIVLTNLPRYYSLPAIDENLVRISDSAPLSEIKWIIKHCYSSYNCDKQRRLSEIAKQYYDYRVEGHRLVTNIDNMAMEMGYA